MARRWQLPLGVLAGLILTVVALWDSATVSAVADRVTERTETVDRADRPGTGDSAPSDLAFSDLDGAARDGFNLLRPPTTTRPPPTTTSTVAAQDDPPPGAADDTTGADSGDEPAPGSATTLPVDGDGESGGAADPGGSSSTTPERSSTTAVGDPAMTTVYEEDFASGALITGHWSIADSVGSEGWGLLRPRAVAVVADPSAAGGHVLAITARPGSGAEAGQVVSGAMRLLGHSLTHGRYSIRARVDADPDGATAGVVLLQPTSAGGAAATSDEIRIIETSRNRATRNPVESTVRWVDAGGFESIGKAHRTTAGPVSAAAWHVYTLDWTADRVTVTLDGEPLTLTADPSRVPHESMDLVIRLDPLATPSAPGEQPTLSDEGEVRLLIDWLRLEQVTGGSSS